MTSHKVLKSFPFSKDGINTITAAKDEDRDDIPEDLVAGLEAEGFIKRSTAKRKPAKAPETADAAAPDDKADAGAPENKAAAAV